MTEPCNSVAGGDSSFANLTVRLVAVNSGNSDIGASGIVVGMFVGNLVWSRSRGIEDVAEERRLVMSLRAVLIRCNEVLY